MLTTKSIAKHGKRKRRDRRHFQHRLLGAEPLEARQMLNADATPVITEVASFVEVEFELANNYNGDVWVRTNGTPGVIEWRTESSTFEPLAFDFSSQPNLVVSLSYDAADDFLNNFAIDTASSLVVGDFDLPGTNITLNALQIDIEAGSEVNTATPFGQSGSMTFSAPIFRSAAGARLITDHAADTDTPGHLLIEAQGNLDT